MSPDDAGRREQDRDDDASAALPIDRSRTTWYWRFRLSAAAGPIAWILMQDASPIVVWLLGVGTGIGVVALASLLTSVELRLRGIQREHQRR